MNKNKKTEIRKGAETSSKIVYSALGACVSVAIPGPVGALAGIALPEVLNRITEDFFSRQLSKNERRRILTANELLIKKIQENLGKGMTYRSDFFENLVEGERSPAEELLELALNALQRDAEEKKLKYYKNLVANILCRKEKEIDQSQAVQLVKIAQDLSWTKLLILATAERRERNSFALRNNDYGDGAMSDKQISLATEARSLYSDGLINFGSNAVLNVSGINPSKITLQGIGRMLCDLMDLREIEDEEIEYVVKIFSDTSDHSEKGEIMSSGNTLDGGTF